MPESPTAVDGTGARGKQELKLERRSNPSEDALTGDDDEPPALIEENEDLIDDGVSEPPASPFNTLTTTTTTTNLTLPRPVATVKKSHSTLSSDLKRRFLKFTKDKKS